MWLIRDWFGSIKRKQIWETVWEVESDNHKQTATLEDGFLGQCLRWAWTAACTVVFSVQAVRGLGQSEPDTGSKASRQEGGPVSLICALELQYSFC